MKRYLKRKKKHELFKLNVTNLSKWNKFATHKNIISRLKFWKFGTVEYIYRKRLEEQIKIKTLNVENKEMNSIEMDLVK